jgi:predicted enzyme related to lactoylglutathione lyase
MTEPIQSLGAVTIHVRDIRRSRAFFTEVLGLRELSYSEPFSRASFALPGSSTVLTMHVQREGEGGREPGTVTGIVFCHEDPFAACDEIRRRGGTITNEPETVERPGVRYTLGVFADPDGNEFIVRAPALPTPPP